MKRLIRIVLLLLTLWPVVYLVQRPPWQEGSLTVFDAAFSMHVTAMALITIVFLTYWVHIAVNDHLKDRDKFKWYMGLLLGSLLVMPIYWWQHVWNEDFPGN